MIYNNTANPIDRSINSLKFIAEELQAYPEIEFSWKEPGIAFMITFTNKNYQQQQELQQELQQVRNRNIR